MNELELSINISDEEMKKIREMLLKDLGVRHYVLEIDKDNRLDVVEYSEYKKIEQELSKYKKANKSAIERINKGIFIIPTDTDELLKILEVEDNE